MAGKVTGCSLAPAGLGAVSQGPSRSSGSLPGTWHGALAQAAARGDRRPQLGSCCQPGRRGHAEPDGCSVLLPAPQGCPRGAGRCRGSLSPRLAGGLGLKPRFLGPPSVPPPAVGRKGQQWETGPALAPAGGAAAAGWDGGELSCPVTWPRGQGGHGLTHAEPLRAPGEEEEEEQDVGMRLPSGLTCPVPRARFVLGQGLRSGNAGWHRERGSGSRELRLPGHVSLLLLSCLRCWPSGSRGSWKTPQTQPQRWVFVREEGSEGQPRRLGRLETPGDGRRLFPTAPAPLAGSAGSGGETRYTALRLGGARGRPHAERTPRHAAGEPGRGSVRPRTVRAAPSDTSAAPPDPRGCAVSPIHPGEGIQNPLRHP